MWVHGSLGMIFPRYVVPPSWFSLAMASWRGTMTSASEAFNVLQGKADDYGAALERGWYRWMVREGLPLGAW